MGFHRSEVQTLLAQAAEAHARLLAQLPGEIAALLPVDAQGLTRAIDHLAAAAGLSPERRRALVRPHGVNPAVLHARVFGAAPLSQETVIGAFIDGARVRADALTTVADAAGGPPLGARVRALLSDHPPPAGAGGEEAIACLRDAYAAHERAALAIAAHLDEPGSSAA